MKILKAMKSVAAALVLLSAAPAVAQDDWPSMPITVVVSFAAGGNADLQARLEAKYLEPILGVPIKVLNVPGGGHIPGVMRFLEQAADGHTFLRFAPPSMVIGPLVRNTPYDPLTDFAPLWISNQSSATLYVRDDSPYQTFDDFIAAAKEKELVIGVNNIGAPPHLAAVSLGESFGVEFKILAQKTIPASMLGLVGGQSDAAIGQTTHLSMFEGEVRALAILDERKPFATADLPGVPTQGEIHPDKPARDWAKSGWTAKAGTDPVIIDKMVAAMKQVFEDPAFQQEYAPLTTLAPVYGPDDTMSDIKAGIDHYRPLLGKLGMLK